MPSISVNLYPNILDCAKFGSGYMDGCDRRQVKSRPLSYTTIARNKYMFDESRVGSVEVDDVE